MAIAESDALRAALRDLHAQQNGPPLERDASDWQAAYDKAGALLAKEKLL